jgi:hypothetical protein
LHARTPHEQETRHSFNSLYDVLIVKAKADCAKQKNIGAAFVQQFPCQKNKPFHAYLRHKTGNIYSFRKNTKENSVSRQLLRNRQALMVIISATFFFGARRWAFFIRRL